MIRNLSYSAIQLILNQVFGLGIFYVLSAGLSKNDFGQINLVLAILLAAFNILSFGIDQITIKKVAAGSNAADILSIYLFHVIVTGFMCYGILLTGYFVIADNHQFYTILLLIGLGKLGIFLSTPFKQIANGMERFKMLASMSVISNVIRGIALVFLAIGHHITLLNVLIIFVAGDLAELLAGVIIFKKGIKIKFLNGWSWIEHKKLVSEALPQTGVVLITSALARFDWIFIGFMVSSVKLAEYSFAYKVFEIATLPLLAIAPLLIPKFTLLFKGEARPDYDFKMLVKTEMIIAAFTVLVLNCCYGSVVDYLTAGKYGRINVNTIFFLSLCIPLLYLNNFLWTIFFAQGRMKMILTSFIITFLVNVAGDLILIPIFKNEGAAIAFFVACLVQTVFYSYQNNVTEIKASWTPLLICTTCALISGFVVKAVLNNNWLILPTAIVVFIVLLFLTAQLRLSNRRALLHLLQS